MKWLFAILVALNVVVFGSMVAGKLVRMNANSTSTAQAASDVIVPANPSIQIDANNDTHWPIAGSASAINHPLRDTLKNNQSSTEDKTPNKTNSIIANNSDTPATTNCSASIAIPEDDYYRTKGLLTPWPSTATRFVVPNKPTSMHRKARYMVMVNGDDAMPSSKDIRAKGFETATIQGSLSLGVFNHYKDAETLATRAKINGIDNVQIKTLGGNDADDDDNDGFSVAKMRVVFNQVNNQTIKDIQAVVRRYGKLNVRGNCR